MILLIIFLASLGAMLGIYWYFNIPFFPGTPTEKYKFKGPWKRVAINWVIALVLAGMMDRGIIFSAIIILAVVLVWQKGEEFLKKIKLK